MWSMFNILLLIFVTGRGNGGHSWSYNIEDQSGPLGWNHQYPECKQDSQSPINIPRTGLPKITDYPPLQMKYFDQAPEKMMIKNNGHTAKLSITPFRPELTPILSGGGMEQEYKFAQAHFHWGADESRGSEHQKSSTSFPMEMHLVHYKGTHSNIMEALVEGAHDSLAVLAVFFSVQLKSLVKMPSMELLEEGLANITVAQTFAEVTSFPLSDLIPTDMSEFYRYNGSLTTPSCNPIVQWTVLKKPVFISLLHLQPFRNLLTVDGEPLVDNFRPVQDIGDREILDVVTSHQKSSPSLPDVEDNEDIRNVSTSKQKSILSLSDIEDIEDLNKLAPVEDKEEIEDLNKLYPVEDIKDIEDLNKLSPVEHIEDIEDILNVSTSKQKSILSLSDAMKKASESMAIAMEAMKKVMDIMNSSP